jgi:hypothetical protein
MVEIAISYEIVNTKSCMSQGNVKWSRIFRIPLKILMLMKKMEKSIFDRLYGRNDPASSEREIAPEIEHFDQSIK